MSCSWFRQFTRSPGALPPHRKSRSATASSPSVGFMDEEADLDTTEREALLLHNGGVTADADGSCDPPPWSRVLAPRRRRKRNMSAVKLSFLPRVLTFNFYTVHMVYILTLCVVGSLLVRTSEQLGGHTSFGWIDGLFIATSAACVTGLTSKDFSAMTTGTKLIAAVLTTLGSHTVMALVPIIVRRHIYRASKGRGVGRLRRKEKDMLLQFEGRVANECEYEALGLLQWIVVFYVVGVQVAACFAMALYVTARRDVWALIQQSTPGGHSPLVVTAFHTVFAFHNAGLSVIEDSLVPIHSDRFLLFIYAFLISVGNVLFPVCLRVAVWVGHHWWDRKGKRKTAFRYLLRNPRRCSTHLFPSVQTRALGQVWLVTNLVEFVAFMVLDFSGPAMGDLTYSDRFLVGFFQSISTRTAGFNVAEISLFSPAMHVLWLMLMYLSSYPFVLTMRQTASFAAAQLRARAQPWADSTPPFPSVSPKLRPTALSYGSFQGTPHSVHMMTRSIRALSLPGVADPQLDHLTVDDSSSEGDEDGPDDGRDELSSCLSAEVSPTMNGRLKSLLVPPSPSARAASELAGIFKGLMLRDVSWLYTAIFFICAFDGQNIISNRSGLTVFGIIFEVVSGYGTVGLSLGVRGCSTSLSGLLSDPSKFIMAVVMLLGRHRGLPDALDVAVPEVDLTRPSESETSTPSLLPTASAIPVQGIAPQARGMPGDPGAFSSLRSWIPDALSSAFPPRNPAISPEAETGFLSCGLSPVSLDGVGTVLCESASDEHGTSGSASKLTPRRLLGLDGGNHVAQSPSSRDCF